MPLPMKTLHEASVELGIPEAEIRALVDMRKIRAVMKKGVHYIAPDEMMKIKQQRKTAQAPIKKRKSVDDPVPAKPGTAAAAGPPKRPVPVRPPVQAPRKSGPPARPTTIE